MTNICTLMIDKVFPVLNEHGIKTLRIVGHIGFLV